MADKPIYWIGSSKDDICNFPENAKRKIGYQLRKVQKGEKPNDFKPIPIIGEGVYEIRVKIDNAYRIFYVAQFKESIYILHIFVKKTEKTSQHNIELGKKRYLEMILIREKLKETET